MFFVLLQNVSKRVGTTDKNGQYLYSGFVDLTISFVIRPSGRHCFLMLVLSEFVQSLVSCFTHWTGPVALTVILEDSSQVEGEIPLVVFFFFLFIFFVFFLKTFMTGPNYRSAIWRRKKSFGSLSEVRRETSVEAGFQNERKESLALLTENPPTT